MLLKPACAADADRLYALVSEYRGMPPAREIFDAYFAEALTQEGRRIILAYQGTEPAGFADAEVRRSLCEGARVGVIHDFFVREPLRRHNIGGGMLLSLTTYFKTAECAAVHAFCPRVSISSQEFLEKRGFAKAQHAFVRELHS